jgi:ABC-type phosphate transport system substrate-binding protein
MSAARWMRARLVAVAVAALTGLCAGILAPAQPAGAAAFAPISGAGSTWSANAINTWRANVAQYGMVVNYAAVGSTVGRLEFKQGVVNWAAPDIPYGVQDGTNIDAPPVRGYTYMPDTAGAVAFMYNLTIGGKHVTNLRLSGKAIAGIFTGVITNWDDPMIAQDNPGLTLPNLQIVPVVRTDGSGATAQFIQWMIATEGSYWTDYCAKVGRNPCTQTSAYPVLPGMVGQPGDLGVAGYVSQPQAQGAIGYTENSYALQAGFPVAQVLNAAGYYTEPTPGHVGVSLLNAQINNNPSDPLYGTADLSRVYTDTDPRTYELSYYSYMILPTDTSDGLTTDKGYTLGAFGRYLLCQGQQQVDALGYSALPINLVEDGYAQLEKIPGASLPATTSAFIASCDNPTFAPDGTNTLANTDPYPPACDKPGPVQCGSGAVSTTTTLTTSPNPATAGQTVTLTATVTAADGAQPAGSVQFEADGIAIGSPIPVSSTGVATTTTSFTRTNSLLAAYSGSSGFAASTSPALTEVISKTPCPTLTGCNLSDIRLSGASLPGADLSAANLSRADLTGANLERANLSGANLNRADLSGANLSGANLSGANLNNVIWAGTICPDGTNNNNDGNTCLGHLAI